MVTHATRETRFPEDDEPRPNCTRAEHEARKAMGDVINVRKWPDCGLVIGECPRCFSTLAISEMEVADAA